MISLTSLPRSPPTASSLPFGEKATEKNIALHPLVFRLHFPCGHVPQFEEAQQIVNAFAGEEQSFLTIFSCLEKGFCLEEFTTARRAALTQERSSASRRGTGFIVC